MVNVVCGDKIHFEGRTAHAQIFKLARDVTLKLVCDFLSKLGEFARGFLKTALCLFDLDLQIFHCLRRARKQLGFFLCVFIEFLQIVKIATVLVQNIAYNFQSFFYLFGTASVKIKPFKHIRKRVGNVFYLDFGIVKPVNERRNGIIVRRNRAEQI